MKWMVRAGELYKDLLVTVLYEFFGMYLSRGAGVACAPKNLVSLVHLNSAMF